MVRVAGFEAVNGELWMVNGARRARIQVKGIVQGVGFRPFVFRLAHELGLAGWVRNTPAGVVIEAEGPPTAVSVLLERLEREAPPLAVIGSIQREDLPLAGETGFAILASGCGESLAEIAPDGEVCPDCLRELFDPVNRRYRYPFINCTNCGPRYSIITGIPYDRLSTTMAHFPMCPACREEYENPSDRRFHAQPIACPECGPRWRLLDRQGNETAKGPLAEAISLLRAGRIVALKGIGGYHLAVDATNPEAVAELRLRKNRDEKPFALMAPDLPTLRRFAEVTGVEERFLVGPERPIVIVRKRDPIGPKEAGSGKREAERPIASLVAPGNGYFGVMLPYTPLHHLLLRENFGALVMTSGNLSDEPIAYRDREARERLADIADAFLVHDRDIHVRSDDSVIRVFQEGALFLRRSRGYVPRGIALPASQPSVLAVGAELKATCCLTREGRAFMSQHVGDLQNAATFDSYVEAVHHLQGILDIRPEVVAYDLHPDYLSTRFAEGLDGLKKVAVQHHHAHMASCMAENGLDGEAIGVIFDGTGFGSDGTIWGGEFLLGDYRDFRRVAHFRRTPLPGGDAAVREPWRMALSWLHQAFGADLFNLDLPLVRKVAEADRKIFLIMLERGINSPLTSSCGRLFDAVAALVGLRQQISYEGQAAIELEALAERGRAEDPYLFGIHEEGDARQLDFRPTIRAIVEGVMGLVPSADIARRFHTTVAAAAATICELIREVSGVDRVVLSGGSFQNRLLAEGVSDELARRGFRVFTHRLVPPNDGGLALGQAVIAGRGLSPKKE